MHWLTLPPLVQLCSSELFRYMTIMPLTRLPLLKCGPVRTMWIAVGAQCCTECLAILSCVSRSCMHWQLLISNNGTFASWKWM